MQEKIGKVLIEYTEKRKDAGSLQNPDLLLVIKKYSRENWNQAAADFKTWNVLKHFSHLRGNLVEWLPIRPDDRVLEIGAECGALTSCFVQKAGEVVCLEKNADACRINAERNQDCAHLTIHNKTLTEFSKEEPGTFDWIFLVGVLSDAADWMEGENPYVELLSVAKNHLREAGKLVVAVDNRLGLRHWAGCPDDEGQYFRGMEGYEDGQKKDGFTLGELKALFAQAGDWEMEFYYPHPDYLLPLSVYSDEYLPKKGDLKGNYCCYDRERVQLFEESKVYDTLIEEGSYPLFANSFLVLLEEKR